MLDLLYMEILAFLLIAFVIFIVYTVKRKKYEKTEYFAQTHHAYRKLRGDKGLLGEYCIYTYLKPLKGHKRFLFNCYLPKEDGETTEVDVILLHESGIYVFESKNYSGWIFGTESKPYWTQTLPKKRGRSQKSSFLNPIIQNKVHLKWLHTFLHEDTLHFYSFIVFSDRCTLKEINLTSDEHRVVNRYNLLAEVTRISQEMGAQLSVDKIDDLYEKLYPLTQADAALKATHIENIQKKYSASPSVDKGEKRCPRCGGKLVLRTASHGSRAGKPFWGCSNYPKCKYVQNMEE